MSSPATIHVEESPALLLSRYWGKANPEVGGHHTVLGHSLDVAACAFILLERNRVLNRRFAKRCGIPEGSAPLTAAALCALHDIGKLDTRFQRKAPAIANALRPETAGIATGKYDHGTEGFRLLETDERDRVVELLGGDGFALLRAVCGHHGALPTRDEPDPSRSKLPRAVKRQDIRARRVFMDRVLAFFAGRGVALPWTGLVDGASAQLLAGLCAIADWIGSNTEYFPYQIGEVDLDEYWQAAHDRALIACEAAGLIRVPASGAGFRELFPSFEPRDVQRLAERLPLAEPALVIIEAEMGKGKTEAALSLASRLLGCEVADGLTVALPTIATANAMFDRLVEVAPRIFAGESVETDQPQLQVALAHGRASRESRFQRLVQPSLRSRDADAVDATVTCARWFLHKKRVLLAQLGVGTIDQALQAALVVRHQFVRMLALSRNVVIVDEVHAYDAYMEVLLEHLLRWLGALDVPVVLLSATLPSERRRALTCAWRGVEADDVGLESIEDALARPYPLLTVATREGVEEISQATFEDAADAQPSRTIIIDTDFAAEEEATARRLIDAAKRGARVAWIRNTVREAQSAFHALIAVASASGSALPEHHLFHARFRGCDRRRIEREVLDRFGKGASPGGRVLVATQVVEQSLDLDFDELHTDLAPIDLLFQRAGRLHRHEVRRPAGFEEPQLVIHGPSAEDALALRFGPSRYVYDAGTLWLAHRAVSSRSVFELPQDIRALVEETYHPLSRTALLAQAGPALLAAEQARADELTARRVKARQCCIPPAEAPPDGVSAVDDDEQKAQAFTRDGKSATLLPFCWDGEDARTLDDPDGDPWALDPDAADAWRLARTLLDQTVSLPAFGDVEGVLARGEAHAWDEWLGRFRSFGDAAGLGRVIPLPLTHTNTGYKGWLRLGGRRRRVIYHLTLGLMLPSTQDEAQR